MTPRQWQVSALGVAVVGSFLALIAAAYLGESPEQATADARPPGASVLTAKVERRRLSELIVLRGTVRAIGGVPVVASSIDGSSPVVTGLPKALDGEIIEGEVAIELSGRPVIALQSSVPIYRDILPNMSGSDVQAVQEALDRLGFATSKSGTFDSSTQAAVRALYERLGYPTPDTGKESFDRLGERRTTVEDADAELTAARRAVRRAQVLEDGEEVATARDQLLAAERARERAGVALAESVAETGVVVRRTELVALPSLPGFVSALRTTVGSTLTPDSLPVEISTGGFVVIASLEPSQARLLQPGQPAMFDDEAGGLRGAGTVASVGLEIPSVTTEGEVEAPATPVQVVQVSPEQPLEGQFNGREVRLRIETSSTGAEVVAAPITAVQDGPAGEAEIVLWPSGERIPVEVGLVAGGWVEIRSPSLQEGVEVRVG